jgi:ABC-type transporter Mla maintaining outer membrane lipid asymmetry ATPase subunit MlaF
MNLSIKRIRQITAAIAERKFLEDKRNRSYMTWEVQSLSRIIASTGMLDEKSSKKIQEHISDNVHLELPAEREIREQHQAKELAESFKGMGDYERIMQNLPEGFVGGMGAMAGLAAIAETDVSGEMMISIADLPDGPPEL